MRQNDRGNIGKIARDALCHITRGRDHAFGAAQQAPEFAAPGANVHAPLGGAPGEACCAAKRIGFAAIAPVFGDQVILRTDRVIVVQRAVIGYPEPSGQVEHRSRQAVDVMEMDARNAQRTQQRGKRGHVPRRREKQAEPLIALRPGEFHRITSGRLEKQHFATLGAHRDEIRHMPPDATAPCMRNE